MWPRPRPEIIGTKPPHAATIGASIRHTVSPTPPVECLSRTGPGRSQSSTVPERAWPASRRALGRRQAAEEHRHREGGGLPVGDAAVGDARDEGAISSSSRVPPSRLRRMISCGRRSVIGSLPPRESGVEQCRPRALLAPMRKVAGLAQSGAHDARRRAQVVGGIRDAAQAARDLGPARPSGAPGSTSSRPRRPRARRAGALARRGLEEIGASVEGEAARRRERLRVGERAGLEDHLEAAPAAGDVARRLAPARGPPRSSPRRNAR